MTTDQQVISFFSQYDARISALALRLRQLVLRTLPGVTEQPDAPARMVAYCYGPKYIQMVCTIIPSKKGVKLGFYKGNELPDPHGLLEGTGKISRYVEIRSDEQIYSDGLKRLVAEAFVAFQKRTG
jgi:hypothetical protein